MAARFDAFISYSRAASSTLAVELRNGIERFAKPWYRLRSSHVFLDDASMTANTGLWSTIERALTESDWFILICSPKAAASEYVTNEITWWLQHKSADRVLLVLDEGTMVWDQKAGDFDWKQSTAVNPALKKAFAEEPRWIEMPWFDAEGSLKAADPRFPERVADLAAAVRGLERDEIVGENVRQRRRALRLLRGGVIGLSVLLVASLVSTAIAVVNGNAATEQARIAQARQLAAQAIVASATDLRLASLLAVEAVRLDDDPQTEAALFQLQNTSPYLARTLDAGARVIATALTPDGTVVLGDESGAVTRWVGTKREDLLSMDGAVEAVAASDDATVVAAATSEPRALTVKFGAAILQGDVAGAPADGRGPLEVAVSADGSHVAVSDMFEWTALYTVSATGITLVGSSALGGRLQFSADDLVVLKPGTGDWERLSLADAAVMLSGQVGTAQVTSVSISGDGRIVQGSRERGINYDGWVIDRPTSYDTLPDLVSTSTVADSASVALDSTGARFASQVDGAIYVSDMRDASEPPLAPLVLDGAGPVNVEALSFVGDRLVSASGTAALVWDLDAAGRATAGYPAPVPEPCNACPWQIMHLNHSGTRLAMTDDGGNETVTVDLRDGHTVTLVTVDQVGAYRGIGWYDDDRVIVYVPADGELQVLSGDGFQTIDLRVPIVFPEQESALVIHADPDAGTVSVLDTAGRTQTVRISDGAVLASTDTLVAAISTAAGFDISPDGTTAYAWGFDTTPAVLIELASGRTLYSGESIDGMAFDGSSRAHVFQDGTESILDAKTGAVMSTRSADIDPFSPVNVSADGTLVVQGSGTGFVSVLDQAARGAILGRLTVPSQAQKAVVSQFTHDGTKLVLSIPEMTLSNFPSTVRVVDLQVSHWIASSCAIAGRDLTPAEWTNYLGTTPPSDLRCDR